MIRSIAITKIKGDSTQSCITPDTTLNGEKVTFQPHRDCANRTLFLCGRIIDLYSEYKSMGRMLTTTVVMLAVVVVVVVMGVVVVVAVAVAVAVQ